MREGVSVFDMVAGAFLVTLAFFAVGGLLSVLLTSHNAEERARRLDVEIQQCRALGGQPRLKRAGASYYVDQCWLQ